MGTLVSGIIIAPDGSVTFRTIALRQMVKDALQESQLQSHYDTLKKQKEICTHGSPGRVGRALALLTKTCHRSLLELVVPTQLSAQVVPGTENARGARLSALCHSHLSSITAQRFTLPGSWEKRT